MIITAAIYASIFIYIQTEESTILGNLLFEHKLYNQSSTTILGKSVSGQIDCLLHRFAAAAANQ